MQEFKYKNKDGSEFLQGFFILTSMVMIRRISLTSMTEKKYMKKNYESLMKLPLRGFSVSC